MANFNRVQIMGNLTRSPIVRHTAKGTAVAEISLAVNRVWHDNEGIKREEVTFLEITYWGRLAEICGRCLDKGSSMFVEGHLKLESWEDKETLQKRTRIKIIGESMQFLGPRPARSDGGTAHAPAAVHEQEEDEQFPL